jgi:hypothetical protein
MGQSTWTLKQFDCLDGIEFNHAIPKDWKQGLTYELKQSWHFSNR